MQRLAFGGGCHWCTEAVFQQLRGVETLAQGFARADPPDETWSEAVDVTFDPGIIGVSDLLAVHLATHASTSDHKMRGKYRSAVYATDRDQHAWLEAALRDVSAETGLEFVTRILAHRGFKPSDPRFHNYYANGPERPFCQTYISPKLAKLRQRFTPLLRPDAQCLT